MICRKLFLPFHDILFLISIQSINVKKTAKNFQIKLYILLKNLLDKYTIYRIIINIDYNLWDEHEKFYTQKKCDAETGNPVAWFNNF